MPIGDAGLGGLQRRAGNSQVFVSGRPVILASRSRYSARLIWDRSQPIVARRWRRDFQKCFYRTLHGLRPWGGGAVCRGGIILKIIR